MIGHVGDRTDVRLVSRSVEVTQADIVALHRSAAMLPPGSRTTVERDLLVVVLDELISQRALLQRLGTDLKTVARRSNNT